MPQMHDVEGERLYAWLAELIKGPNDFACAATPGEAGSLTQKSPLPRCERREHSRNDFTMPCFLIESMINCLHRPGCRVRTDDRRTVFKIAPLEDLPNWIEQ